MDINVIKRYHELEKLLSTYSKQYYLLDDPSVSDAEYDKLYNELLAIENEYPEVKHTKSPSQKVGASGSKKFKKVKHLAEMISLENAYNENDISDFFERVQKASDNKHIEIVLEPKFDGLSVALSYKNGFLITAATRGDGITGEDVTQNMLTLNIPTTITNKNHLEVRGEVIMLKDDFQQLNDEREKNNEKLFSNPRNAAAGSLRQLDPNITKSRKLKFFPYAIVTNDFELQTQIETIAQIKKLGFNVSDKTTVITEQSDAYEFYKELEKHRSDLEYDIDGVVYKVNDIQLQKKLGSSAKFPRHSIAYKFPAEKAETTILDIVVQVGRSGNITPVAELRPVNIGGAIVARATLHNKDEITKKDLRVGDRVIVERAGDVIPKILFPITSERQSDSIPFIFPEKCPSCGSKLIQEDGEVAIKCININCKAQTVEKILHFVSKNAFDISGFGEQNVKSFFELGFLKSPIDIFELEMKNNEIHVEKLSGWGKQSAINLFESIKESRNITLDKFIYSFGIPNIGRVASKLIAEFFISYDAFLNCIYNNQYDNISQISGIGGCIVDSIRTFFDNEQNLNVIKKLGGDGVFDGYVNVKKMELSSSNKDYIGTTIVFTGTLNTLSRNEAKTLAE